MGRHTQLTRHHIVPQSREGSNNGHNVKMLRDNVHVAFHIVFDNLTPDEQFQRLLSINETALRREFREKVEKILEKGPDYTYKDGVFVPDWYDKVR